jgi:hypothetical protein
MDHLRIDREPTGPGEDAPLLDRAWAATRPPELAPADFDRIWAEVRRAHDARPAVLAMTTATPRRPRGRTMALVALGLAQVAAAALVAAWALNRPEAPRADRPALADRPAPPAVVARLDVEVDETAMIDMGSGRVNKHRRPVPEPSLAMLDLPEMTASDMLGYWETRSQ